MLTKINKRFVSSKYFHSRRTKYTINKQEIDLTYKIREPIILADINPIIIKMTIVEDLKYLEGVPMPGRDLTIQDLNDIRAIRDAY